MFKLALTSNKKTLSNEEKFRKQTFLVLSNEKNFLHFWRNFLILQKMIEYFVNLIASSINKFWKLV